MVELRNTIQILQENISELLRLVRTQGTVTKRVSDENNALQKWTHEHERKQLEIMNSLTAKINSLTTDVQQLKQSRYS